MEGLLIITKKENLEVIYLPLYKLRKMKKKLIMTKQKFSQKLIKTFAIEKPKKTCLFSLFQ